MGTWIINGVMRLFSLITPRVSRHVAPVVASALWYLNSRRRHITRRNIELCYPGLDPRAQTKLARESLVHYVRNVFEAGILWYWSEQRMLDLFTEPSGKAVLDAAREAGKGVIIAQTELAPFIAEGRIHGNVIINRDVVYVLKETAYGGELI